MAGATVGGDLGYLLWLAQPELEGGPEWRLALPLAGIAAGAALAALAEPPSVT